MQDNDGDIALPQQNGKRRDRGLHRRSSIKPLGVQDKEQDNTSEEDDPDDQNPDDQNPVGENRDGEGRDGEGGGADADSDANADSDSETEENANLLGLRSEKASFTGGESGEKGGG